MSSSWLAGIGGAAGGLEEALVRNLQQEELEKRRQLEARRQTESERSNLATEDYRRQALKSAQEDRQAAAGALAHRTDVDDTRLAYSNIPMKTIIPPAEEKRVTGMGALPPSAFEDATVPGRIALRMGAPEALAENEDVRVKRGTPTELAAEANRKALEADRAERGLDRDLNREQTKAYRDAMLALSRQREGRLQDWGPPPVTIGDPNVPGGIRVVPRSELPTGGAVGPQPAANRIKVDDYKATLDLINNLMTSHPDPKTWDAALGPLDSRMGKVREATGVSVLGGGGGQEGSGLRSMLNQLRAQASFERGGKSFTATEKQLLEDFIALATQQPDVALQRLQQFKKSAETSLGRLGVDPAHIPPPAGQSATEPAAATDPYAEYLRRNQAPSGAP